jgi:hypothetical protein
MTWLRLTAILLMLGSASSAQAARVEADRGPFNAAVEIPDGTVRLGDPVTVTLQVSAPDGVDVLMPAFGEFLGQFAVLDYVPRTLNDTPGTQVHEQRYTLQLTRSGKQRLPSILIEFVDLRPGKQRAPEGEDSYELITDVLEFEVEEAADDLGNELTAPLPALTPRAMLQPRTQVGLGILVLLVVAGVLAVWWWHRRQRAPEGPSASEAALSELRSLAAQPCETPAEVEAFFVALSAIVRRYMENRFGVHAPELTTEEFLIAAQEAHELPERERAFIGEFLSTADQVKFAGVRPSGTSARDALERVEISITRTASETHSAAPHGEQSHA